MTMKKTLFALLLVILLTLAIASPALAAEDLAFVVDSADILSETQWAALENRATAITERYACDVAIFTIDEMTDDDGAYEWAKYVYEEAQFGYGADKSGILLFLSMAERDYALTAYGYGNTAFTDHGKDVMLDGHILPELREDNYFAAFSAYLDKAEEYLGMARAGTPFDTDTDPENARITFFVKLAAVILLPLLIAFIVCGIWKRQMKTAVAARAAAEYISEGGFQLTNQADMFLYRTEDRRKIETKSSSGGTTRDSGGYSGRSGKF